MRLLTKRALLGLAAAGLSATALAGCQAMSLTPEAEATAKTAYEHFVNGEDAELKVMLDPELRTDKVFNQLARVRAMLPKGPTPTPKTVNWRAYAGTGGITTTVVHQYDYPQNVVTVTTTLSPIAAKPGWILKGFWVNISLSDAPLPASGAAPAAKP